MAEHTETLADRIAAYLTAWCDRTDLSADDAAVAILAMIPAGGQSRTPWPFDDLRPGKSLDVPLAIDSRESSAERAEFARLRQLAYSAFGAWKRRDPARAGLKITVRPCYRDRCATVYMHDGSPQLIGWAESTAAHRRNPPPPPMPGFPPRPAQAPAPKPATVPAAPAAPAVASAEPEPEATDFGDW